MTKNIQKLKKFETKNFQQFLGFGLKINILEINTGRLPPGLVVEGHIYGHRLNVEANDFPALSPDLIAKL